MVPDDAPLDGSRAAPKAGRAAAGPSSDVLVAELSGKRRLTVGTFKGKARLPRARRAAGGSRAAALRAQCAARRVRPSHSKAAWRARLTRALRRGAPPPPQVNINIREARAQRVAAHPSAHAQPRFSLRSLTHMRWLLATPPHASLHALARSFARALPQYYEKDGQLLPGAKGIALSPEQWATVLAHAPQVEAALAALKPAQ